MLVVEGKGRALLAYIAIMRALRRGRPRAEPTPRKKRVKRYRVVRQEIKGSRSRDS
jgi:hypothetical protein